jgi:hypothetical protein
MFRASIYRRIRFVVCALALGMVWAPGASADVRQHGAITITSNTDFTTVGSLTGCACVSAGTGTPADPYVIGPWAISAPSGGTSGWAIKVDGSGVTKSFVISGIAATYSGVPFSDPLIWLVNVNNPAGTTVSNVSANEDGLGVKLDHSSHISLDQLSLNKMTGNALFIYSSSYVNLSNSKLKSTADGQQPHNADGLYALDSDHLSIGGVTACAQAQICNTFDYDTGWGVYLEKTSNVTIDGASANADDTGSFILDGSSFVNLGNSTAGAGGPICITLNGQKTFTGYHTDMQGGLILINGSHDNVIHDDQIPTASGSGPGFSIGSGGNRFFFNPCTKSDELFSPVEAPMGMNNTFTNVCFTSTDIVGLPPNPCK